MALISLRALNLRIKKAYETFGESSHIYQSYVHYIKQDFPNNYNGKKGYIQLHGVKITGEYTPEQMKIAENYEHLTRLPTTQTLIQRGKKVAEDRGLKKITRSEAIWWAKRDQEQRQNITANKEDLYEWSNEELNWALETLKTKGKGRRTYEELDKIEEILLKNKKENFVNAVPRKFKL